MHLFRHIGNIILMGSFEISLDYISCPELENRVVIFPIPCWYRFLARKTIQFLREEGHPSEMHVVTAIACTVGIEYVQRSEPNIKICAEQ